MNSERIARFADSQRFFICPVCGEALRLKERSLVCARGHCFDLSKYGYVNLLRGQKPSENYSRENFVSRRQILERGYYAHILSGVTEALRRLGDPAVTLDVGCGEGYYSRCLQEQSGGERLAFDLSKDSVQIAAQSDRTNAVRWFVGDLMRLPLRSGCIDCVLDIFAPANYAEFARVLIPGGHVVKVIPGDGHLKEFRAAARDQLRSKDYSNESVVDYFAQHLSLVSREKVSVTFDMPEEDVSAFADMTPLFFSVDRSQVDCAGVKRLTVEAEILTGGFAPFIR